LRCSKTSYELKFLIQFAEASSDLILHTRYRTSSLTLTIKIVTRVLFDTILSWKVYCLNVQCLTVSQLFLTFSTWQIFKLKYWCWSYRWSPTWSGMRRGWVRGRGEPWCRWPSGPSWRRGRWRCSTPRETRREWRWTSPPGKRFN